MTPSTPDVARITHRLRLIEEALRSLSTVGALGRSDDVIVRAATERFVQLVVDLALDVNAHLTVALGAPAPETGRGSFLGLADLGVLSTELAEALAPRAGLRNLLVHHYTDVSSELFATALENFVEEFDEYIAAIARHVAPK